MRRPCKGRAWLFRSAWGVAIDLSQYLVSTHSQQLLSQFTAQAFAFGTGRAAFYPKNLSAVDSTHQPAQPQCVVVFQQGIGGNGNLATPFEAPVQGPFRFYSVRGVVVIQRCQ